MNERSIQLLIGSTNDLVTLAEEKGANPDTIDSMRFFLRDIEEWNEHYISMICGHISAECEKILEGIRDTDPSIEVCPISEKRLK